MSIKKSLQSSILLMAVIPVILTAVLAYITATTKYADVSRETVKNTVRDSSYGFQSQLKSQIIETKILADTNNIKNCILDKITPSNSIQNDPSSLNSNVTDSITRISESFNHCVNYYIYDIDGYLVASSSDAKADWTEIMQEPIESYTETTVISNSNFTKNTLDIISPVIVKKQIIGLVRSNISAQYFEPFLSEKKEAFIMDYEGQYLFNDNSAVENDQLFFNHILTLLDEQKKDDKNDFISNIFSENQNYIYGYSLIPEYNWIYVIKQNTSAYTNILSTLPIVLFILLIIVIIFSIHISQSLAVKYTQPILELSMKMQDAADGQLDVHCQMEREDEFGLLSSNFNQMMEIISTNYNAVSEARTELEEKQLELEHNYQHIEKLAYTDALTSLYNRMAFYKYANEIISDNKDGIKNHAIIFIDLDGFKSINDTLGHDYGDLLLQAVATQFSSLVAKDDILARNGGDEFVILRNHIESREELENFLFSLVSIASHTFTLEEENIHITISAGVSLFPQNGLSLGELMKNADIAMYASKARGKNSYTFFDSSMEDEVNRRNDLIDILRDAIDNKDVYLLYQPQADISTGEIIGCEALMRLNSPIIGFVSPDEFIPVAEECGLIDELGEWALLEACSFNQRLIDWTYVNTLDKKSRKIMLFF